MNVRTWTKLALLTAMQPFLETKVVELALEASILGMSVILAQNALLECLGFGHDNLANAANAATQVIRLVGVGNLP